MRVWPAVKVCVCLWGGGVGGWQVVKGCEFVCVFVFVCVCVCVCVHMTSGQGVCVCGGG